MMTKEIAKTVNDTMMSLPEDLRTKEINGEHFLNQDYVNSKQIWDINSAIKIISNLIDWVLFNMLLMQASVRFALSLKGIIMLTNVFGFT